jgi:hypothetical protein
MNSIWLSLLFLFTFISGASAQSVDVSGGEPNTDAGSIIAGVVLMLIGLVFVFAGKRIIKLILFVVGFVFFGALSVWISSLIVDIDNITQGQRIGIIVGSVVVGLIGGLLSWCLYQVGVVLLGFLGGFALGGLILSGVTTLDSYWARFGIMVAIGVVIAIVTLIFMNLMIIITTSFVGSQAFMIGVDAIANKGYTQFAQVTTHLQSVSMTAVLWAMLGSSIALALIGIIFQYKAYPKRSYHNKAAH